MGYLGATLTQVFTRMCGRSERVSKRCHNGSEGKRGYRVRETSRTGSARRILGDFEKVSGVVTCLERRRLTFGCSRRPWAGVARDGGGGR